MTVFHLRSLISITMLLCLLSFSCQREPVALRESEKLLQAGTPQHAVSLLEPLIETHADNPKVFELLGKAYSELGRSTDAATQFRKASQLYDTDPEKQTAVRFELARTYLKFGDRDSAFRVLRRVLQGTTDTAVVRNITALVGDVYHTNQLTTGNSDNYAPTFSPAGTYIAFSSVRTDSAEIYLMDVNGQIHQRVTFTPDFNDSSPAFLADPHYLFYSSEPKAMREPKVVIQSSGSTPIFAGFNVTHIYGKTTHTILPIKFGARVPRTSPTGNQVIYESNADGNLELYLLDFTGIDLSKVTPEQLTPKRLTANETDDGSPTFFPDGKRIAFVSSRGRVHQLYTMDIEGKNEKRLTPGRYDSYMPTVSPDGKTIAYVSARDGDMEIYLIDADGKNERKLTGDIGVSIQPTFSPDSRSLVYVSDRDGSFHIYLMDFEKPVTRADLVKRLQR